MANEVQKITHPAAPVSGSFTITFSGQTTAPIAWNANAAAIIAALEALSNIGVGDVGVSIVGLEITITFQGALANTDLPEITIDTSFLKQRADLTIAVIQEGDPGNANEIQEFSTDAESGTYDLVWSEGTASAEYNVDNTAAWASAFGPGEVSVSGTSPDYFLEWLGGTYAQTDISTPTLANNLLVKACNSTVSTVSDGSAPSNPPPVVSLTASTSSIAENGGTVNVIATMDATASATVTVAVGFAGSAATGSDYTVSTTSIAIASGQTSGSLTATAINDSVYEGNEQFTASITSVTGGGASASSTASTSVVTIVDDETQPTVNLSASATTLAENGGVVYLAALLSHASYQNIDCGISFGGDAVVNTDYSRSAIIITVPAGSTSGSISITALQDTLDENNETITVQFGSITNGTAGATTSLSFTITDDDAVPTVTLSASATTISENAGTAYFLATLSAASGRTASFTVNVGTGTATSGVDFTASTTSFFWPAGVTTASIGVTSLADILFEANETIVMLLSSPTNCAAGVPFSASITIVNEYLAPFVSLSASAASLAESGSSTAIVVSLDHTHSQNVTIVFGFGGTATDPDDYTKSTNSIIIASGASTGSISITSIQDSVSEGSETIVVSLASVTNGTAASAASTATVIILDDDLRGVGATGLSGLSGLSGIH